MTLIGKDIKMVERNPRVRPANLLAGYGKDVLKGQSNEPLIETNDIVGGRSICCRDERLLFVSTFFPHFLNALEIAPNKIRLGAYPSFSVAASWWLGAARTASDVD